MKIKVSYTIDIDEDLYMQTYGMDKADVRDDVKIVAEQAAQDHFDRVGVYSG